MQDLHYDIVIAAPVAHVWDCMFDATTYADWTRAFCEGSTYEGSWAQGARIVFRDPDGNGMEAIVDEHRLHERLSLRLVGEISAGRPVADSPLAATPAHERYEFSALPGGGTQLTVHLQSWNDGFLAFLQDTWPRALQRLKVLAESTH